MKRYLIVIFLISLATLILLGRRQVFANDEWTYGSQGAPSGLMEQVVAENFNQDGFPVDPGRLRFRKIQQPGQPQPLYLIDSQVTDLSRPRANPLCGAAGCAFFGYLPTDSGYQKVLDIYLQPFVPEGMPLIEATEDLVGGVPCLVFTQQIGPTTLEKVRWCYDGEEYNFSDSQQQQIDSN